MIVDPINDGQCLGLALGKAREWSRSEFAHNAAARYRSTEQLAAVIRALPQLDDDGAQPLQDCTDCIACDYPVRLRRDPRNPNCVERSVWYLAVAEVLDPSLERTLITVPLMLKGRRVRHTNVVERAPGGEWRPVALQPEGPTVGEGLRNATTEDYLWVTKDVVHGIGKGVFGFYAGDAGRAVADDLGNAEDQALSRHGEADVESDKRERHDLERERQTDQLQRETDQAAEEHQVQLDRHEAATAPKKRRKSKWRRRRPAPDEGGQ